MKVPKEVWAVESKRVARMNALTQARSILSDCQRKDKGYFIRKEHVVEVAAFFENWILRED